MNKFIPVFEKKSLTKQYPANIHLFKGNNRNTWKRCEMCKKLTMKKVFSNVSIIYFEQVNVSGVKILHPI